MPVAIEGLKQEDCYEFDNRLVWIRQCRDSFKALLCSRYSYFNLIYSKYWPCVPVSLTGRLYSGQLIACFSEVARAQPSQSGILPDMELSQPHQQAVLCQLKQPPGSLQSLALPFWSLYTQKREENDQDMLSTSYCAGAINTNVVDSPLCELLQCHSHCPAREDALNHKSVTK